jgi:hypothetical protein
MADAYLPRYAAQQCRSCDPALIGRRRFYPLGEIIAELKGLLSGAENMKNLFGSGFGK